MVLTRNQRNILLEEIEENNDLAPRDFDLGFDEHQVTLRHLSSQAHLQIETSKAGHVTRPRRLLRS